MDIFEIIYLVCSAFALLVSACMICVGFFAHKSLILQKLYMWVYERGDYKKYNTIKSYIVNNKMRMLGSLEAIQLRDRNELNDEFYYSCFENGEIVIYDKNDNIYFTPFYNKVIYELIELSGYTQEDIDNTVVKNNQLVKELHDEIHRLESEINEIKSKIAQID